MSMLKMKTGIPARPVTAFRKHHPESKPATLHPHPKPRRTPPPRSQGKRCPIPPRAAQTATESPNPSRIDMHLFQNHRKTPKSRTGVTEKHPVSPSRNRKTGLTPQFRDTTPVPRCREKRDMHERCGGKRATTYTRTRARMKVSYPP